MNEEEHEQETIVVTKTPAPKSRRKARHTTREVPRYHVILLDDDDHSYEYVISMLRSLFGHSVEASYAMACEVDGSGRVIVDTTSKERAEFKRDQIHAYGADPLIKRSEGSMSATIEPADD
ncbi:MAG: ATP-dependent Clp protease adaptor ClpS [Planctomycetota bacterium]|nr:ATP-dependent Clp protease adaptor ClpS [Planctomycetota bacterium]